MQGMHIWNHHLLVKWGKTHFKGCKRDLQLQEFQKGHELNHRLDSSKTGEAQSLHLRAS